MPNCFQLTRKGETKPVVLQALDEELCKHFQAECHPKWWYNAWYDCIGFMLATGKTFDQIEVLLNGWIAEAIHKGSHNLAEADRRMREINSYLREHYTSDAWAEIGRH